jgi:hypothetical protein
MIAIVTGMIATYPVGGMAWDYGQYLIGLEKLGWDVYYLEDTGLESYHADPSRYLDSCLHSLSPNLGARWHYRPPYAAPSGMSEEQVAALVAKTDLFLNVSGGCLIRDEYMSAKKKILVDTDPGLNQFVNYPKWDREPGWQGTHGYRGHDFFFTYAENIGRVQCNLPDLGLTWQTTRPLVVMDCWVPKPPGDQWTTVMSWNPYRHYNQPIEYQGVTYGAKEMEFVQFENLPSFTAANLELAVAGEGAPDERWRQLGWRTLEANTVSQTPNAYRDYIQGSRGEFSVAKNVYVKTHCGWFSCRSVCYLAAGRPCVVQDTGFSEFINTGNGLFAFNNLAEAVDAIHAVEADYELHSRGAVETAREYFDSTVVLNDMLEKIGLK